jgi:hypothetical protein
MLSKNYNVFVSVLDDSICIERDGALGSVVILTTTKASNGRILLDLRYKKTRSITSYTKYTYIIAVSMEDWRMWMIPVDDVADNRTLTLSDSKDCYLIDKTDAVNAEYASQVSEAVKTLVKNLDKRKESAENIIARITKEDRRIENILNTK